MREKQQAAREYERQKRRTIESYCQDVLRRQEEFERKVRVQSLPLGRFAQSIFCRFSVKGKKEGCEVVGGEQGNQCRDDGKPWVWSKGGREG